MAVINNCQQIFIGNALCITAIILHAMSVVMLVKLDWGIGNVIELCLSCYIFYVCVIVQIGIFGIFANVHTFSKNVFANLVFNKIDDITTWNLEKRRAYKHWKSFLRSCYPIKFNLAAQIS